MSGYAALPPIDPAYPADQISTFLNANATGSKIAFPANLTYTLEEQIELSGISNATIDINGCTFKLPDNCAFLPTYDRYAARINNCSNVTFLNGPNIDGNKANNVGNDCYGLKIINSPNITIRTPSLHDVTHHAVWIASGTPGLKFYDVTVQDNYGHANAADIYIENGETDDVEFYNTTASRDAELGNQVFYVNGYGTTIDGVEATDIHARVVDYRKGVHTLNDLNTDNCAVLLVLQGDTVELAANNLTGINGDADINLTAAIRIVGCARADLSDISVTSDLAKVQYYGLTIEPSGGSLIDNVTVTNFTSVNARQASVRLMSLANSVNMTNITCNPDPAPEQGYTIAAEFCTAQQFISGLTEVEPHNGRYDPDNVLVVT